jgi:hypothetical protein
LSVLTIKARCDEHDIADPHRCEPAYRHFIDVARRAAPRRSSSAARSCGRSRACMRRSSYSRPSSRRRRGMGALCAHLLRALGRPPLISSLVGRVCPLLPTSFVMLTHTQILNWSYEPPPRNCSRLGTRSPRMRLSEKVRHLHARSSAPSLRPYRVLGSLSSVTCTDICWLSRRRTYPRRLARARSHPRFSMPLRGGPGALVRSMELHVHDPPRYAGDMLL